MKNKSLSMISLILSLVIIITGCTTKPIENEVKTHIIEKEDELNKLEKFQVTNIEVPYEPIKIDAEVKPYKVEDDLSNIVNLNIFGEFSKEQLELLKENAFVVNPTKQEQLFYIYEDNEYKDIPSFITTDSVLQVYHIFYDYALRTLENEKLLELLEELTEKMLKSSIDIYNKIENQSIKEIQLKNIEYFSVAQLALEKELPNEIPEKAKEMALEEIEKIKEHKGLEKSSLFPYDLDYSQFTVRGHYTRSKDFERYFKAMMWYGQAPFPLYLANGDKNIDGTIQALLICYGLYKDKESYERWENIYEPTNFFVGSSDDLGIYEYGDLLFKVYGNSPNLNKLDDEIKLKEFYEGAKEFPEPKIQGKYTSGNLPVGKQFRFMGQRYVLDAEIIQELVHPLERPIPSGLDIMGVLGSKRAKQIQMDKEENQGWKDYPEQFKRLENKFGNLPNTQWMGNMYQGWLWTLLGFLQPFEEGYPSFMTTEAWMDKDLNTALGSWSELKHDTILYGKQSAAEMGGEAYEEVVGYVEPNIEVYEKLLWLTKFSRENLNQRNLSLEEIDIKIEKFESILEFLISCSIKELRNEELTSEEYDRIQIYGGILEDLTASFSGENLRWFEITSETDKNMAIIADFHTITPNNYSEGGYLEAGVGSAYEIYVVVPIGDKLYLTRGAVFSYHEFISEERLTDEKWQQIINENKQPNMPQWTNSFIKDGKAEIPYPQE